MHRRLKFKTILFVYLAGARVVGDIEATSKQKLYKGQESYQLKAKSVSEI